MPKLIAVEDIKVRHTHKRVCKMCKETEELRYIYPPKYSDDSWEGELLCKKHRK